MGQILNISTYQRKRQSSDAELDKFVLLTKVKLCHPSCSNLTMEQKDHLLEKAIDEFWRHRHEGTKHGNY